MRVIKIDRVSKDESAQPIFEGKVARQALVDDKLARELRLTLVSFTPGARTKLHTHTFDQVLLVTSGKGILSTEQEENQVIPGMLVVVPAGEKHWHGATKDSAFSHVSITTPGETKVVE